MGLIVAPKQQTTIACWNVRTLAEATWTAQVAKEMAEYGIEVLGICDTRLKGMRSTTLQNGVKVVYVGDEGVRQGGVAIMISTRAKRALMEWTPISKRILLDIQKADSDTNLRMMWWMKNNQLQGTISSRNRHYTMVLMGDLNVKIRSNKASREEVVGKFGVGVMNDNGEWLYDFCSANGLVITGKVFPHKEIYKLAWRSPDGKTVNQIDHVMVNRRMRTSVLDPRVMTGADIYSDPG